MSPITHTALSVCCHPSNVIGLTTNVRQYSSNETANIYEDYYVQY